MARELPYFIQEIEIAHIAKKLMNKKFKERRHFVVDKDNSIDGLQSKKVDTTI